MYIWILLATIMVALSFFNLSPRADKDGTFEEIKSATVVNRFMIEHRAFSDVAECKLLTNSGTHINAITNFNTDESNTDGWLYKNKALPIGYISGADLTTHHYTYCLSGDVTKGLAPAIAPNCSNSGANPVFRYGVSFATIPDKWIAKDSGEPLPVLSNALSKQYLKNSIIGILECGAAPISSCSFSESKAYVVQDQEGHNQSGFMNFSNNSGFYASLFNNADFVDNCAGASCFFAIRRFTIKDRNDRCKRLYDEAGH